MKVGFTGTQQGMTAAQQKVVASLLLELLPKEAHHGDCIGADEQFHNLCRLHIPDTRITVHPPDDPRKRAFCEGDVTLDALPYLKRNHAIVDAAEIMIATPQGMSEERRSGTWATIRYARKQTRILHVILPDGTRTE